MCLNGNVLSLHIPRAMSLALGIERGDTVIFSVVGGSLLVTPIADQAKARVQADATLASATAAGLRS